MIQKVSLSILLGQLITSTANTGGVLIQASTLKFKKSTPYGKPIEISFDDPTQDEASNLGWIGIYRDYGKYTMDEIPGRDDLSAWQNTWGGQDYLDPPVFSGTLTFSSKYPYSTNEDKFPYVSGNYRVCYINYNTESEVDKLIICKPLKVKAPKSKMIEKAKVKAPAKLKDDKRMSFKVKFKTPITVQNQWMGLYHAESDGGLPIDMNSVLTWVYTGCNNQEGNQSDESCVEEKKKGAVNFVLDQQLKKGSYRACVHFAINEPFDLFKCSEEIKVVTSPTESPSASPISLSPTDSPTESPSAYPTSLIPTVSPIFSPQCPIHEITMIDRQTSCSSYAYQNGFYRNRFREGCNKFVELDGNFDGCINHCNTCNESACRAACRNGCNYMICEGYEGRFGCNNPPPVAWETSDDIWFRPEALNPCPTPPVYKSITRESVMFDNNDTIFYQDGNCCKVINVPWKDPFTELCELCTFEHIFKGATSDLKCRAQHTGGYYEVYLKTVAKTSTDVTTSCPTSFWKNDGTFIKNGVNTYISKCSFNSCPDPTNTLSTSLITGL